MGEIDKEFDGVFWDWKGKKNIKDLKPICPECKFELNIERRAPEVTHKPFTMTFYHGLVYSCPRCSFSKNSTIDNVDSPENLRKAARKEFEHKLRLKA